MRRVALYSFLLLLVATSAWAFLGSHSMMMSPAPPPSGGGGGGTVACDIGPSYTGAIPAGASRAGYTHCLANLDFTQTASFADNTGTHTWSNLATWYNCFGAGSLSILFNTGPGNVACDSSHYAIVTDGGKQVLQMTVLAADVNTNGTYVVSPTSLDPTQPNFPNYNGHGWTLPVGFFVEYVMRMNRTDNCTVSSCPAGSPFSYSFGSQTTAFAECDFGESYSTPTSAPMNTQYCSGGSTGKSLGPMPTVTPADQTNYHTYGFRATTDGSTDIASCNYFHSAGVVSGLTAADFLSCTHPGPLSPPVGGLYTSRVNFLMDYGCFASCTTPLSGGRAWNTTNYNIQRFTFWTCAAGVDTSKTDIHQSTAQCNAGLIVNSP